MTDTKKILDTFVYGHEEPKQHILRILAQWIANPSSKGNCIGIHGSPISSLQAPISGKEMPLLKN